MMRCLSSTRGMGPICTRENPKNTQACYSVATTRACRSSRWLALHARYPNVVSGGDAGQSVARTPLPASPGTAVGDDGVCVRRLANGECSAPGLFPAMGKGRRLCRCVKAVKIVRISKSASMTQQIILGPVGVDDQELGDDKRASIIAVRRVRAYSPSAALQVK